MAHVGASLHFPHCLRQSLPIPPPAGLETSENSSTSASTPSTEHQGHSHHIGLPSDPGV